MNQEIKEIVVVTIVCISIVFSTFFVSKCSQISVKVDCDVENDKCWDRLEKVLSK